MSFRSQLISRLIRWTRYPYNQKNFKSSLRRSKVVNLVIKNPSILDMCARSSLRLSKYAEATKYYRQASKYGFSLREQHINHFTAELKSGYFFNAYSILYENTGEIRKNQMTDFIQQISKLEEFELTQIIKNIGNSYRLNEEIINLLPWAPKKVELNELNDDSYYSLSNELLEIDRYKREIYRIKKSAAYQISKLLTSSFRKPKKFIALPISLPVLIYDIINNKRGLIQRKSTKQGQYGISKNNRNCIILFPTNGVGFGHFTRLLSIAKKLQESDPKLEIIFFTTMPTLHILANLNFPVYHISGRYRFNNMDPSVWNSLCEEMLNMIFLIHRPHSFIFDGAFPYRGLLDSLKLQNKNLLKVWLRRGAIKKNSKKIPVDSINYFDAIIRPGDSVEDNFEEELNHGVSLIKCNPILSIEKDEMMPRGSVRSRLGIPLEATVCYLQLGAGNINDINDEITWTMDAISKYPHIYVVLGESMLGSRINSVYENSRILRDYPNAQFFNDFDFAIMAGGYNSFHEAIEGELPTICYPNLQTGRDDQYARAQVAANAGCMVVLKLRTKENIQISIARIVEPQVRANMRCNFSSLKRDNGANQISKWLLENTIIS